MKLRAPVLEVPKDDPFRFDLVGRKHSAEMLTEIIKSTDEPLVVGIDADWGRGKSTFLRMWMQHLENEGVNSLYFNAWESDFSDDAFVSILGELEIGMSALSAAKGKAAKKSLQKAKKVGLQIVRRSIPTAVKLATAGILNLDDFTEQALAEAGEKIAAEKIKSYESSKNSVGGFKDALRSFAEELNARKGEESTFPLVIIVDELDRCRPSYAIDVLETAKHLFSVPGVVFVVAADWTQLGNVVRTRYGIDTEVGGYLRRFIDVTFSLPASDGEEFLEAQFEKFGLTEFLSQRAGRESQYDFSHFKELFLTLFKATNCSYRDQERCFTLLSLAIKATPQNMQLYGIYLSALIVLKVKNPNLFKLYVDNPSRYSEVLEYFKGDSPNSDFFRDEGGYGPVMEAFFVKEADDVDGRGTAKHADALKQKVNDAKISETERARLKRVLELIGHHSFRDHFRILGYLREKIDFVSKAK